MELNTNKVYIDVDRVIQAYNDKNPDKQKMTREILAEILGVKTQVFSNWKSDRQKTPRFAKYMLILLELGDIPATEFIRERK